MEIRIDKKSELMNIMLYLSDYNNLLKNFDDKHPFNKSTTYGKDIIKHFSKFKKHKTIQLLNELVNGRFGKNKNTFCYDAPICLIMQLNEDFTYSKLNRYPFHTRLCRDNRVLEFLDSIPQFVEDTRYENFFASHKTFYDVLIKEFKKNVDETLTDDIGFMYKLKLKNKFVVNLMPTIHQNNYGFSLSKVIYSNIDLPVENGTFDIKSMKKWLRWLLFHEFSHSIVNPLSDKYLSELYSPLSDKTISILNRQAYSNGVCYFNESVIRAMTILYENYFTKTTKNEEKNIIEEENRGFVHTRLLLDKLKEFQSMNISFEEFYPTLQEVFETNVENINITNL